MYPDFEMDTPKTQGSNDGVSTTGLPYTNEYNFIFDVVEVDGQWKITHVKEFVDSQFSIKFHAEEVKRQQELAK